MANSCLQLSGFLVSFLGWLGIVIATSTNDWVNMCKYGLNTCKKMDELGAKGPWAECVISTGLYHCVSLTQILELPGRFSEAAFQCNHCNHLLILFSPGCYVLYLDCVISTASQHSVVLLFHTFIKNALQRERERERVLYYYIIMCHMYFQPISRRLGL